MKGVLTTRCSSCGMPGTYEMNERETQTAMAYKLKGRAMGLLKDLFPNAPAWIISGSLDPLAKDSCICPACEKKRK